MKNEVNSALQANGNSNLSGLHREGYRMARFLLYKNSANSHSMHCNSSTAISTKSEESPSNHAAITGKSPRNHPVMAGILKHAALLLLAITLGVGEMWAWDSYFTLGGTPVAGTWTYNDTYRIQAEGDDGKGYFDIYMEKNETFCLYKQAGNAQYGPNNADDQNTDITIGATGASGYYKRSCWVFKSDNQLVRVNINRKGTSDQYYPTLWITKRWDPKDDINDVLSGSKVMFYYGDVYNEGHGKKYLYAGANHTSETWSWFSCRKVNGVPTDGGSSSWNNFAWGAASVASARYYVSNSSSWEGVQMANNAVAGCSYMLYNNDGNKLKVGDNRSLATFSSASYSIEYGASASSVSASCNNTTSAIGKTNSIYKYYTKPSAGSTWSEFNPSQNISLAPGTYDLAVIVTDGLIYVKGATTTLTVTETKYTVTLARNNTSYGTVNAESVSAGKYTHPTITATPNAGYYFTGWTKSNNNVTITNASSTSTTVSATGTATVTANFAKRWVLRGSRDDGSTADGMPLWSTTTADMSVNGSGVSTKTVTLLPNRKYKYMIYDKKPTAAQKGCTSASEASATQGLGTEWTLNGTNPVYFSTKGYGTYTFTVRVSGDNPAVTVTGPTSYAITMGTTTWTEGTGSVGTGGTNTAKTTEASTDYAITNGQYIRSGGTAVFSATPNTGYQFMGWYNASNYNHNTNEPISTDNPYTIENITSAKTVYALFQEIVYDVTVSLDGNTTTTKKAGCVSHPSITAVVPSGKVFDRWITTGSATVASPYSKTTTITGASDNQSTVTATFKDLPKIYYCKELTTAGWTPSDMYVYFYKTGGYWNESNGSGSSTGGGQVIAGPCKMTKIAGKNIWYYEYNPEAGAFAGKTIEAVSFIDKSQSNTANFASCSGTYRGDFASCLNMFVLTSADGVTKNSSAYYRNTGYWHNYGEVNSGFYLNNLPGGSTEFVDEDGDGVFEATANLDEKTTYYFYVGGCGGWNWSNNNGSYPFNTSNRTRTLEKYDNVASDTYRCKLTTTDAGYYTFKLTPSNTAASLSITVDFPLATNDYRATITRGGKKFPSNIIKSGTSSGTISLWLDNGSNTVAIEKFNGTTWVSQVSRTVTTSKKGVYTMTLTCNGASSTLSTPEEYTGDFYIRTDCAPGNWKNYKENKLTENTLTFSEEDATTFNYYFCKWVSDAGTNVRFVVANDYNMAISDTLKGESALGGSGPGYNETLPAPANVRFSYNSYTNGVNRAYISGSSIISDRFLVMKGDTKLFNSSGQTLTSGGGGKVKGLNDYEMNFIDKNNWVYQVDVQAQSGALVYLIARYNGVDRDLYGSSSDKKTLITSTNESTKYHLTTIYDFKTNNLMTAWKPGADAINENISNVRSVMLARSHHQNAEQITIGTGSINNTTIYGVMQFSKYTLNNQSTEAGHATLSPLLSAAERSIYWISFPFDVRLKEVFGFGHYYQHWAIEYYDGAERAAKGYWIDSDSFWKLVSPAEVERGGDDGQGFILKKNVGYLLVLDLDLLGTSSSIWNNSVTDVALYFPSKDTETITNSRPTSVEVPEHNCTIDRRSDEDKENNVQNFDKDRRIADSHWNVIGVPSYANVVHLDSVAQIRVKDSEGNYFTEDYPEGFGYYYAWDPSSNTYNVSIRSTETTFKTMHAYMLQFAGTINWQEQNSSLYSAPARTNSMEDYDIHLELMKGEAKEDQTFVRFSEKEDVTAKFEFSQDITKIMNAKKANIYTLIEGYIPAGGNSLPFSETTTIIPVGVKIATNDDYTFTIPDGTDGIGVTLIDNVTGSRTNLSALDYTVSLEAGTHNERFVLEISPIHKVPTELEPSAASDSQSGARKLLIDGLLYIVRDGKMFDAQGRKISDK